MKTNQTILLITITIILSGFCSVANGFANKTHKVISEQAIMYSQADAHIKNQLGFSQGLGTTSLLDQSVIPESERIPTDQFENRISPELPSNPCTLLDFLKAGSHLEDVPVPRARHHFHAPIANPGVTPPNPNSGLDNKTDHPNWVWFADKYTQIIYGLHFDLTGVSALERALGVEGTEWETEYKNYFAWPDTRTYFYRALTKSNMAERNHYLALTFLSLGQTTHLLEDMGVPAHARNDFVYGHMRSTGPKFWKDWGNPFEDWVEEQVEDNNDQSLWSGSEPVVFDKLAKYFDTDTREPNDYLGDGITPPDEWGLAECTNYQFLSLSTVFGCSGIKYQFPHPAMGKTTLFLVSVPDGLKGYFDGSNYGVTHLARDSYTRYKGARHLLFGPSIDSTITTDDVSVFTDYADVTIPRTIDYATGLINYFFRGSLDVSIGCPQGCNPQTNSATYSMTITNTSINTDREQVLKGGTFEFYWEDLSGNRTEANDFTVYTYDEFDPNTTELWGQDSILPYGEHIRATASFNVPSCTDIANYAVVYEGAINDFEYPDDTDFSDPNAIACWVKSESNSVPASSYTLLVTEWGGTDEYYECAEYLKTIFDSENPDGYTLAKTPDSTCFDCRWRFIDYHTCPYGSPYCYTGCNVIQIMLINSAATDEFCVIITPFPVAYCGFGPLCNGSYRRCFSRQPGESYEEFWARLFNGGVFGDGSETDCIEDGCIIPAFGTWTDSWVRVIWLPNP